MKVNLEIDIDNVQDGPLTLSSCWAKVETEDLTFEVWKPSTSEALENLSEQIASEAQDLLKLLDVIIHLQHHLIPCDLPRSATQGEKTR